MPLQLLNVCIHCSGYYYLLSVVCCAILLLFLLLLVFSLKGIGIPCLFSCFPSLPAITLLTVYPHAAHLFFRLSVDLQLTRLVVVVVAASQLVTVDRLWVILSNSGFQDHVSVSADCYCQLMPSVYAHTLLRSAFICKRLVSS